ncbi:aromatase/cyclase [Brachybacterium squillarum]|uniref:aromatase/cyclase n=1 Tax=Brachybacterium squillarum TaxID=661979 RepID=UPI0002629648|nr:SRPBCC family protein [Brachybacterium squillarum]
MEHSITINAPTATVQEIICEATRWPVYFPPTIACEQVLEEPGQESLKLWARNGDSDHVVSWRSVREVDAARTRVAFRQVEPVPPLTSMSGAWTVRQIDERTTELGLTHALGAADQDALRAAAEATDFNSTTELAGIKTLAETYGDSLSDHFIQTHDEIHIGAAPSQVFALLWDVSAWPRLLRHVDAVTVHSQDEDQHRFSMTLAGGSASAHGIESVRVARTDEWIAFKQTRTPDGVYGHAGTWTMTAVDGGTLVMVRHLALLERVEASALHDLSTRLSTNLRRSSLATLEVVRSATETTSAS